MSEDLRLRIAAEIRSDLAAEAASDFALLRRFPNSETAGMPAYFQALSASERESLLTALAEHATLLWDHEVARAFKANPIIPRLGRPRPVYPPGDWYGGRPKKGKLKKAVVERLVDAGFSRLKREGRNHPDYLEFSTPDKTAQCVLRAID